MSGDDGAPKGVDLSEVADDPAEELTRAACWYLRCAGNFEQSLAEIRAAVESTERWATTQDLDHADAGGEPDETVEIDGELVPVYGPRNPWPVAIIQMRIRASFFFPAYPRLVAAISACHRIVGAADSDLRRISTLAAMIHGSFPILALDGRGREQGDQYARARTVEYLTCRDDWSPWAVELHEVAHGVAPAISAGPPGNSKANAGRTPNRTRRKGGRPRVTPMEAEARYAHVAKWHRERKRHVSLATFLERENVTREQHRSWVEWVRNNPRS